MLVLLLVNTAAGYYCRLVLLLLGAILDNIPATLVPLLGTTAARYYCWVPGYCCWAMLLGATTAWYYCCWDPSTTKEKQQHLAFNDSMIPRFQTTRALMSGQVVTSSPSPEACRYSTAPISPTPSIRWHVQVEPPDIVTHHGNCYR